MYDVVLLDLDLTLFDFHTSEIESLRACLHTVGIEDPEAVFPRYHEINRAQWARVERGEARPSEAGRARFEVLLDELGIEGADPVELSDLYQQGLGDNGQLYDGVAEVLDALVGHVALGLVTNGITDVQRAKVRRLQLDTWFEAIVISDEVGVAKPDPIMFESALERLGRPRRDRALMVGDSMSSDIDGAHAAGIGSCWFNPNATPRPIGSRVDHEIRRLGELLELIASPPRPTH